MRIALIHPAMDVKGGAENQNIRLAMELAGRGHEVVIFAQRFNAALWAPDVAGRLRMRLVRLPALLRWVKSTSLLFAFMERYLARELQGFDVAIGRAFPTYAWAAAARRRACGAWRVVWLCPEPLRRLYPEATDAHLLGWRELTPAGEDNPHLALAAEELRAMQSRHRRRWDRNRRIDVRAAAECDLILTNSEFTAANLRTVFGKEAHVCYEGVDPGEEPDYCAGDYVGVLTSLSPKKNVHNTLRAVARLAPELPDLRLRVAGGGRWRGEMQRLAGELGIAGRVEFVGLLPDDAVPEFYRRARLLVYCPVDEPFGLVPLEAMAMKTPVVASNHGGPTETVVDGETGLLANPFDPSDIARGIRRLWLDAGLARRMGEAGRRRVCERFTLSGFAGRFEAALAAAVRG